MKALKFLVINNYW